MPKTNQHEQILPLTERYCIPQPNEVRFVTDKQTISLILGSCISTVFIGKGEKFIAAANHIVIAKPLISSLVASKSAQEQVDEIFNIYNRHFNISKDKIICLHLIGAGRKVSGSSFKIHEENIVVVDNILEQMGLKLFFKDVHSHYASTFSLDKDKLSVFILNQIKKTHISYVIDLHQLFEIKDAYNQCLPAITLEQNNKGFEFLVENGVIIEISGSKQRSM